MHDHNNQKRGGSMMWMVLGCIVLLAVLFFAGGSLSSSGILWPILIGIFVAAHVWMMFKGHGGHKDNDTEADTSAAQGGAALEKQPDKKDEHKHGGCCH